MSKVKICTGCSQVCIASEKEELWGALGVDVVASPLEIEGAADAVCPDCEGE